MRSIEVVAVPPAPLRRAVTAALVAASALLAPDASASVARNGVIAYEGRASSNDYLYLRKADGSRPRWLPTTGRPSAPAVSPFGRRVAFSSNRQIWTVFVDGTALHQVTSGSLPAHAPTWAPGADALAFAGGPRGAGDIYRVGADGSQLRRLTFSAADERSPAWSSRGRIAFTRRTRRGDGDLFTISAAGGRAHRVTRGTADDADPAWSPDGRLVAFTRAGRAAREVFVTRADGRGARRLTRLRHRAFSPAWSPNGRYIAFALEAARGRRWLYLMRRDGRRLRRVGSSTSAPRSLDWQATGFDPVVAAAGDVACDPASSYFNGGLGVGRRCGQAATSDALLKMDLSAVFALGDLQYEDGRLDNFLASFDPAWGRLKPLIRPAAGNHEYRVPGAAGYFDYFNGVGTADGPAGPRGAGYYSFDLGSWHIVALNSQCTGTSGAPTCVAGSPQEEWLRADLAAHPGACTLAFFHHPLISSGIPTLNTAVAPLWQALVEGGVDVALTGHDHAYERFAPINAAGGRGPASGVREFVVGTGGRSLRRATGLAPNSELRRHNALGVLELTLHAGGYSWNFVNAGRGAFRDTGSSDCH